MISKKLLNVLGSSVFAFIYIFFFLPLLNQESKQQDKSPDESDLKDLQVMLWGVLYM